MWLGSGNGTKTLIFLLFSMLSIESLSNPYVLMGRELEQAVSGTLTYMGVDSEQARKEGNAVRTWAFGSPSNPNGYFTNSSGQLELDRLFTQGMVNEIVLANDEGEKIKIVKNENTANQSNSMIPLDGNIVIKEKRVFPADYSEMINLNAKDDTLNFMVGPEYLGNMKAALYRTEYKINLEHDYVYANDPISLFKGFFFNTEHGLVDRVVDLYKDDTRKFIDLYRDEVLFCSEKFKDICPDSEAHFDSNLESFDKGLVIAKYIRKVITNSSAKSIEDFKELGGRFYIVNDGEEKPVEGHGDSLADYYVQIYELPIIRLLPNEEENNTMIYKYKNYKEVEPIETEIIYSEDEVGKLARKYFAITKESSNELFTNIVNKFISENGIPVIDIPNIDEFSFEDSEYKYSSYHFWNGFNLTPFYYHEYIYKPTRGHSEETASTVIGEFFNNASDQGFAGDSKKLAPNENYTDVDRVSRTTYDSLNEIPNNLGGIFDSVISNRDKARTYRRVISGGGKTQPKVTPIGLADADERPKPKPIGVVEGADNNAGSGINHGARDNNIGSNSGSTHSSSNSNVQGGATSSSRAGAKENADSRVKEAEAAGEKAEEKEKDKKDKDRFILPDLDDVSGRSILQPLLDLQERLIGSLIVSVPGGTCPVESFEMLGKTYTIDAHCSIYERISGVISAFALAMWGILAFRVVASA